MAYWYGEEGNICRFETIYDIPRPGQILYFFKHLLYIKGECFEHVLCFVYWFQMLRENERHYYGKPIELCYQNMYELGGPASFIPVQRLKAKFVSVDEHQFHKDVMVCLPRYKT